MQSCRELVLTSLVAVLECLMEAAKEEGFVLALGFTRVSAHHGGQCGNRSSRHMVTVPPQSGAE